MGCQEKIEDQESLNVFIQSLFSDADRLNVSKLVLKIAPYFLYSRDPIIGWDRRCWGWDWKESDF